jgi:hypothetical protein
MKLYRKASSHPDWGGFVPFDLVDAFGHAEIALHGIA